METIFDYNPTDDELVRFGGREFLENAMKAGIDPFEGENYRYYSLALLFSSRGDKERAMHYASLIKEQSLAMMLFITDY